MNLVVSPTPLSTRTKALEGALRQDTYEKFYTACRQMMTHRQALAYPTIDSFILRHVDVNTPNVALMSHIIAESLFKRLDSNLVEGKNIYVQQFDIPQIKMFYKMAKAYPHIYVSHEIANQYLAHVLRDMREVTLLDVGIGKGVQVWKLLTRLMMDWNCRLEHVRIVGLDPDIENLHDAGQSLERLGKVVPFRISYQPICELLENLSRSQLEQLRAEANGNLAINASYALHHIFHPPDDKSTRNRLFYDLAALRPRVFTLVEPDSDHDTESLSRRFHNCWHHFGTVFDLIDESDLPPAERFLIKETFFGREIRDMFGASDRFRCERHEPSDLWLLRFARAGFRPLAGVSPDFALPPYANSAVTPGLVRLGYRGMNLISVLAQTLD